MNNYIVNAINVLTPWWGAMHILCYTLGVALFVSTFYVSLNNARERTPHTYMWMFIASIICFNLPAFMDSVSFSIFETASADSILTYTSDATNGSEYITFSVRAVMLIGLIGAIRGVNYMRDTPQRAKNMPMALTHMIGGTLAVNIVQFLQTIGSTAGGDVNSYIELIF